MYWTIHVEGGPRRVNHATVAVGENVFSFGGYCSGQVYRFEHPMDVYILNTISYRWQALPLPNEGDSQYYEAPFRRYGHTAVAYNGKIYIWGGRNDVIGDSTLFCFDPETCLWSRPRTFGAVPSPRDGHSACITRSKNADVMYIFGGFEEGSEMYTQEVYMLEMKSMNWFYVTTQGRSPSHRDFHTATAYGSKMYIFGGRGDRSGPFHTKKEYYCNKIMYLDTETLRWHKPNVSGQVPIGRRSHSAFFHGGYIYIFGGYNGVKDDHYNDLYRFDPERNIWQRMNPHGRKPLARRRQSCVIVGDRMFLTGGTSPTSEEEEEEREEEINGLMVLDPLDSKLMDHDDLNVLDFYPSLKVLCILTILNNPKLCGHLIQQLPEELKWEIKAMTYNNKVSEYEMFRLLGGEG